MSEKIKKINKIEVFPVHGIPKVKPGDSIAKLIASNFKLCNGDVVVICSSLVSKAEGRIKDLEEFNPSEKAKIIAKKAEKDPRLVQAVLEESDEILIERPFLLVKRKDGNVCVNAGIDRSNVEEGKILLLPINADRSAEKIRKEIEKATGKKVGVIITDSEGRCFRRGIVGFAIGCSGVKTFRSWIGKKDLYGNELKSSIECVADEIAAFANLVMGEGDFGIPAVVIRGLKFVLGDGKAKHIFRNEKEDVIRRYLRKQRV